MPSKSREISCQVRAKWHQPRTQIRRQTIASYNSTKLICLPFLSIEFYYALMG
uniref:Uncharacterized protein n=1 Tax=Rhizophora mucronata TaxID=61149 RepID=A0A2P2NA43_RHIMU